MTRSFDLWGCPSTEAPPWAGRRPHFASRLDLVRLLAPNCHGFGVMEVNPMMDFRDMTSTLAAYLVFTFAVHAA